MLFIRSEQLFDLARRNSLWYIAFGIACCAIEGLMSASGPRFDFDRMGVFFRNSPRQADVMIVAGTVNKKMAETVKRLYDQMPEPKWVVAMGACASTGGPFREYPNVVLGVDKIIPVDVYIPGCPPRPESVQYAFIVLQKKSARRRAEGALRPVTADIERTLVGLTRSPSPGSRSGVARVSLADVADALAALKRAGYESLVDFDGTDTGEFVELTYAFARTPSTSRST